MVAGELNIESWIQNLEVPKIACVQVFRNGTSFKMKNNIKIFPTRWKFQISLPKLRCFFLIQRSPQLGGGQRETTWDVVSELLLITRCRDRKSL